MLETQWPGCPATQTHRLKKQKSHFCSKLYDNINHLYMIQAVYTIIILYSEYYDAFDHFQCTYSLSTG